MGVLCSELQILAERVFLRQEKLYDLVINIPPGTTKSTIVTIMFPVWCWVRDQSLRFISASYSADISLEHALKSRDILQSEKFQKNFPHINLRQDKEAKSNYENEHGGSRLSTSTGGRVTGAHGHFILIDDPLNPKQAMAETRKELKASNDFVDRTLSTRKVDKRVTPTVLIMQRLAEDDNSSHMLKKGKNIRHICLPAEVSDLVSPIELKEKYVDGLLDPVRHPHSVLKEAKMDMGSVAYAGQFEQRPTPEGGGLFKTQSFQFLQDINPDDIIKAIRYWDKAATQGAGAFSAGVLMYKMRSKPNFIIADVSRGQWSWAVREAKIKMHAQLDGQSTEIWTEQEPGSGGKESAESTIINLAGFIAKKDRVTGSKEARAEPYSAQVEIGNVGVLERPWTKAFIDEHEIFPMGSRNDQVDSASGAFAKHSSNKEAGVWGARR